MNGWTNKMLDTGEEERISELKDKSKDFKEITQIPKQRPRNGK